MVTTDEPRATGDIGGQPKKTYWTPDGRQIRAMPDTHEFNRLGAKGQVVESGIRDANYDRGWLETKPAKLKPYCPHCGEWHDTQKEIAGCGHKQKVLVQKSLKELAKGEPGLANDRVKKLETDMDEIKTLLKQLLKERGNVRTVLQRKSSGAKTHT